VISVYVLADGLVIVAVVPLVLFLDTVAVWLAYGVCALVEVDFSNGSARIEYFRSFWRAVLADCTPTVVAAGAEGSLCSRGIEVMVVDSASDANPMRLVELSVGMS
jgi:hypothetical protein